MHQQVSRRSPLNTTRDLEGVTMHQQVKRERERSRQAAAFHDGCMLRRLWGGPSHRFSHQSSATYASAYETASRQVDFKATSMSCRILFHVHVAATTNSLVDRSDTVFRMRGFEGGAAAEQVKFAGGAASLPSGALRDAAGDLQHNKAKFFII